MSDEQNGFLGFFNLFFIFKSSLKFEKSLFRDLNLGYASKWSVSVCIQGRTNGEGFLANSSIQNCPACSLHSWIPWESPKKRFARCKSRCDYFSWFWVIFSVEVTLWSKSGDYFYLLFCECYFRRKEEESMNNPFDSRNQSDFSPFEIKRPHIWLKPCT